MLAAFGRHRNRVAEWTRTPTCPLRRRSQRSPTQGRTRRDGKRKEIRFFHWLPASLLEFNLNVNIQQRRWLDCCGVCPMSLREYLSCVDRRCELHYYRDRHCNFKEFQTSNHFSQLFNRCYSRLWVLNINTRDQIKNIIGSLSGLTSERKWEGPT